MNLKTATIIALATGLSVSVIMNIHQQKQNAKIMEARRAYFHKINRQTLDLMEAMLAGTRNSGFAADLIVRIDELKNLDSSVK